MDRENEIAYTNIDRLKPLLDEWDRTNESSEDDGGLYGEFHGESHVIHRNFEDRKEALTLKRLNHLKEFEISNLLRLGVIELLPISYVSSESIKYDREINLDVHHERYDYRISELGEILLCACLDYNMKK